MIGESQRELTLRHQYLRWYHGAFNVTYILLMHMALFGWLWFGRAIMPFGIFVIASILFSVIHQRLLSEWFHEATHWNIVAGRTLSDALGDVLLGTFNGTRVKSKRAAHFRHHATTEFFTADDPDTASSMAGSRHELIRGIRSDLSGMTAIRAYFDTGTVEGERGPNAASARLVWTIWLVSIHGLGLFITFWAGYYDIYPVYFFGLLFIYPLVNRFRLYLQHATIGAEGGVRINGSAVSRTCFTGLLGQLLIVSPMIMYHHEHHARPGLPYRALRATATPATDSNISVTKPLRMLRQVWAGL